ncbi:MAG: cysteine desulfurase family protein [Rhodobacteraceae bacterium]|nr:cysteine desulfurase family protein [Paracoccaceae bacterium]
MSTRTYLDWNATSPMREVVKNTISEALDFWGNPSAIYQEGRVAKALIERARVSIGSICGFPPEDVIFTSGATEGAALALRGKDLHASGIEHECVRAWTNTCLTADRNGLVEIKSPIKSCLQVANGETGVIQAIPRGLHVTDGTQALGKIPTREIFKQVRIAFISSHKIGGLKGTGALLKKPEVEISPNIRGGGQEYGFRSGTENVLGIIAFAAALEEADKELRNGEWERIGELRDLLEEILLNEVKDMVIFGRESDRLPNTSYFTASGWKSEHQIINLDLSGFAVSAGSACSSGKLRSSGVLEAMGVSSQLASSAIRVSLGPTSDRDDVLRFARLWIEKLKNNRN